MALLMPAARTISHLLVIVYGKNMLNSDDKPGQDDQKQPQNCKDYINNLSQHERMLLVLLKELYMNNWDDMLADLNNRLDGKPYIFKLANRIKDDIARIEQMREYEKQNGVRLSEMIADIEN